MRPKISDLETVLILTLVASLASVLLAENSIPRAILTLPLALFLPGYALAAAIFPNDLLGFLERIVLALGLSLSLLVLGGIVLNYLPIGLQPESWIFLLYGTALFCAIVAYIRRGRISQPDSNLVLPVISPPRLMLIVGAVSITILGLMVSYTGVMRQPTPGFTQLWIQPDQAAGATAVQVGLLNAERRPAQYRLEVFLNDTPVDSWPSILLQDGEGWDTRIDLSQPDTNAQLVEAYLYLLENPDEVYRHVTLRVTPSEP